MQVTHNASFGETVPLMDPGQHVACRYLRWCWYDEPGLTSDQKAQALEVFAAEFEALPPYQEPYEGWASIMAHLCRRIAGRHRGVLGE